MLTSAAARGHGWIGLAALEHEAIAPDAPLEVEGQGAVEPPVAFPLTRPLGLP